MPGREVHGKLPGPPLRFPGPIDARSETRGTEFGQEIGSLQRCRRLHVRQCQYLLENRLAEYDDVTDDEVLWAIESLGDLRHAGSSHLLLKFLSFESPYAKFSHRVGVRGPAYEYPAVKALISIGLPRAQACAATVYKNPNLEEIRRQCLVIDRVLGPVLGRALMEEELERVLQSRVSIMPDGEPLYAHSMRRVIALYDELFPPAERGLAPIADPVGNREVP